MKYLILLVLFFLAFRLSAQKVEKRNLTKRQYFFYDVNKTQIESEGFYYIDDLGETTLRHGKWRFYDREGELQEERSYYKNQLHGEVVLYFSNGKKNSIGYFKNDIQDSVFREWDETGVLRQEGQYLEGQPTVIWNYFYRDGKQKMK
jgi:antitoxin component YwqK of YwqJK toxin-antitoxin module